MNANVALKLKQLLESYANNEFKDDRFDCLCPGKIWTFQGVLDTAYRDCVVLQVDGKDELSCKVCREPLRLHLLMSHRKGT